MRHQVVGVSDMEPTGIYAAGGIPQMAENPHTYRQEVKTTVDPFNPQSYLAKVLMGKQSPMGMSIKAVDDPLLQEVGNGVEDSLVKEIRSGKYKSAEEFVNSLGKDRTQSVGELVKRGYPKDQAEFIARKSNEMGDMKSPSVKDILENPSEYTQQKGGSRTIFRVVPEGRSIENGDYVFTSKAAAEEFLNTHGRIRGQNKIVSLTTDGKNLLERKRHDNGELIFLPQEIQTKSQLTDLYNKAQGTNKK